MDKVLVKITRTVPTTIFELPKIKERVNPLFKEMENDIKSRFYEIKDFLTKGKEDSRYNKICYDDVATVFKIYFYKSILNDAVEVAFSENSKYDVVEIIVDLLCKEKLKEAILGEPMIWSFEKTMRALPSEGGLTGIMNGSTMLLLEKQFLGRRIGV